MRPATVKGLAGTGLKAVLGGVLLLGIGVTGIGCGQEDSGLRASVAVPGPSPGGVLRVLQEAPGSLDPALTTSVYESLPVNQIFDGLVALDPGMNVRPALASTWTISRDGRSYVFQLRPDVRFHDGVPLTSDDVVHTFRRLLRPGRHVDGIVAGYLTVLEGATAYRAGRSQELPGVRASDPLTVEIRLERSQSSFLEVLAMDGAGIVPRHIVERDGDESFGRVPIGTGPFYLKSRDANGLRLGRYPDYHGGPAHVEELEILFLRPEDDTDRGVSRLLRGEGDVLEAASEQIAALGVAEGVVVHRFQQLSLSFIGLNTGMPPLDDVRVRQAFAHAINREAIATEPTATRRLATGILPPGMPGYSPRVATLPHDPARARALLAEAGYPSGKGLAPVVLLSTRTAHAETVRRQLTEDMAAVGIPLEFRAVSWRDLASAVDDHEAPAFMLGWVADLPDPHAFLETLFLSQGSANYFDFRMPLADELLREGACEMNPVLRAQIYREAERVILQQVPLVPLHHAVGLVALRGRVHGLEPGPLGLGCVEFERVWVDPEIADPR